MKKRFTFGILLLTAALIAIWAAGCGTGTPEVIVTYTPTATSTPSPKISSVNPDSVIGGETLILSGENFSAIDSKADGTVTLKGVEVTNYVTWTDTSVAVKVPKEANSGSVVLNVNGFESNSDVTFTRSRDWRTSVKLDDEDYLDADTPETAIDPSGNIFVVYAQDDGSYDRVRAAIYNAAEDSWGSPEIIDDNPNDNSTDPHIAVYKNGNAACCFRQNDGTTTRCFVTIYDASNGSWSDPVAVDDGSGFTILDTAIAYAPNGDIQVVYVAPVGSIYRLFAIKYSAATKSWGTPELIDPSTDTLIDMILKTDSQGNAYCLEIRRDTTDRLFAVRYDASTGSWGEVKSIDNADKGVGFEISTAVNSNDDVFVFYSQDDTDDVERMYVSMYDSSAGTWGTPEVIDNGRGHVSNQGRAAAGPDGMVAVIIEQDLDSTGSGFEKAWINIYDPSAGAWKGAVQISQNPDDTDIDDVAIAINSQGKIITAWEEQKDDSATFIERAMVSIYDPSTGEWSSPEIVDAGPRDTLDVGDPTVEMDEYGNAMCIFLQVIYKDEDSVFATRYW